MGYADTLAQSVKTVATLEFSSERKCMSTIIKGYEGKQSNTILLKAHSSFCYCHSEHAYADVPWSPD
jgi:magnesium-transporting ATPase (P-type)